MKSLIPLLAGVVVGIAGTVFTYNTANQEAPQAKIQPEPTHQTTPKIKSPFATVSKTAESNPKADPIADLSVVDSPENKTTTNEALNLSGIANIKHYHELQSSLQALANADSEKFKSLLNELPENLYDNAYASALNTAIYQRWAETDIDAALLHVVEAYESQDRRRRTDPGISVSILASMQPDYVSEWIENYASENPALMHAAYSGIASNDPEAFIKNLLANSNSDNLLQSDQFGAVQSALMQWADQDPKSVIDFLNSEAELGELAGMKEQALYMWFDKDPDSAIVEIEAMLNDPTSSPDSRMMLSELYTMHLAETDPDSALQWALTQDDAMQTENTLMNIIYSWDENNSGSLMSFIDQLPAAERDSILPMAASQIAGNMAATDPAGAIDWAEQLPQGARENAIMSVVGQWTHTDPENAISWLRTQPDTPENQILLMSATGSMMYSDPTLASEMFSTLPENLQNDMTLQMVHAQADQDPETARNWVSQQTNPTVQEIGFIVLDSMSPDVDAISILDRIASLQVNDRENLLMRTISERAPTDRESVNQWVIDSPLLTDTERTLLTEMTGMSSRFGMPIPPFNGGSAGMYFQRRQ